MPVLSYCTPWSQHCYRTLTGTANVLKRPLWRVPSNKLTLPHAAQTQSHPQAMPDGTIDNRFWHQTDQPVTKLVVLVLNYHLPRQIKKLLHQANFIICADGGANRLLDAVPRASELSTLIPHVIAGDLDSIRPDVQDFFKQRGSRIIDLSHDQDTTDLQKCLSQLEEDFPAEDLADTTILAAGGLGGRLDHTLNALSTLHKWRDLHIILWGDGSTAQLLSPGKHTIKPAKGFEGPTCGLVPLNGPATITSKGLKWDMTNARSEFTGLISTSNQIVGEVVEVETDADVVWITEVVT